MKKHTDSSRTDIIGILCLRVLSDFDLQQEALAYISTRPEIQIMEEYVEARLDYLLEKFPQLKEAYEFHA